VIVVRCLSAPFYSFHIVSTVAVVDDGFEERIEVSPIVGAVTHQQSGDCQTTSRSS
jgi:hypothetical protein